MQQVLIIYNNYFLCNEYLLLVYAASTSVTIDGFVLYAGGDYTLQLNIILLVQVMAYM